MENNTNNNLKARLDEIKQGETVNDIVSGMENNQESEASNNEQAPKIPDMSKIPQPNLDELRKPIPGGVDMGKPLMNINIEDGTLNGEKFEDSSNDVPVQEPEKELTPQERAQLYREKNRNITIVEKEEVEYKTNPEDRMGILEDASNALEEDSRRKSEELHRLANMQQQQIADQEEKKRLKEKGIIETNDVDDIIDNISESAAKKELDVTDEEDLTVLIQKMEEQKVYAEVVPNKEVTGPSNYIIEEDESFKVNVEEILQTNGMRIVKKNSKTKDAVLNRFVNSGPQVSMPLINSGMFISISGAGTDEIIAMQQMENDTPVRMEINKLNHVCTHITNSSVGKLKLSQLLDIVSYYDKDTLYYALYAASYPDDSEFMQNCYKCGQQYYVNIRTRDLLLNPDDFEEDGSDIKDNVTTLIQLVEKSKLGKVYKKVHSNGMIVYVKHPSIKSYLETLQSLSNDTMSLYPRLVDLAYSIDKIAIHVSGNDFMEFTDPNEIIEIISKFKDTRAKYEIYDMINEVRPNTLPAYGIKECKCPHCQAENPSRTYEMEDMIFMQAQQKEELEAMKWAAKNQKKLKEEKNKSKNE